MERSSERRWLHIILILGIIYCLDGIVFGMLAGWSTSLKIRTIWRLAAWLTSAALFAAHIWYERFRLNNSPRKSALHVATAAALGAFGLAVAANINALFISTTNQMLLALSLVLWPVLTAVPAFVVAFGIISILWYYRKRV